jgi:hypothetical protein
MSPTTGAPGQKKRALSRIKWMIWRPKTRCCALLRTMSALLRGPKTEPWGVYQVGRNIRGQSRPYDALQAGEPHNHPISQPMKVEIDARPSGATKERSQSYDRPPQAKRVQTIAQTTAPTPKRLNRATSASRAFPSIFHPRIGLRRSLKGLQQCGEVESRRGWAEAAQSLSSAFKVLGSAWACFRRSFGRPTDASW